MGVLVALESVDKYVLKSREVMIFTDSNYVIQSLGEWGRRNESRGWKVNGKYICNWKYIKKGVCYLRNHPCVHLRHIRAHTGKLDVHSRGNAEADRLARKSVSV